jgi:hypothetical protein
LFYCSIEAVSHVLIAPRRVGFAEADHIHLHGLESSLYIIVVFAILSERQSVDVLKKYSQGLGLFFMQCAAVGKIVVRGNLILASEFALALVGGFPVANGRSRRTKCRIGRGIGCNIEVSGL